MPDYNISTSSWSVVKNTDYEVIVLPWGSFEAHNYHLPYSTDSIQAEAIALESARIAWESAARVAVLPAIPFGVQTGQQDIKLDINLNPSTILKITSDIIETLNRQKLYKFVVLNGHGGNEFKPVLRELQYKYPKMFLSLVNWYAQAEIKQVFENPGDHAAEMETSMMLHIAPELVSDPAKAGEGKSFQFKIPGLNNGTAWAERQWSKISEDTGVGNPRGASKEKGEILFNLLCRKIAGYLVDLHKADLNQLYQR